MRLFRRRAFTLVELLVVIAIIGILVALLLPAVQAAREAARRMQCSNNLKQLDLALQNYHDANKRFPPQGCVRGWFGQTDADNYAGAGDQLTLNHSGWVSVLPYMEQQGLYNQYNHSGCAGFLLRNSTKPLAGVNPTLSGNARVVSQVVQAFICPSDGGPQSRTITEGDTWYGIHPGSGFEGQKTNYDFSAYRTTSGRNWWRRVVTPWYQRPFGENSSCDFGKIADGTSNTVLICETLISVQDGRTPAWGYRGWVSTGIDIGSGYGINNFDRNLLGSWYTGDRSRVPGLLFSWGLAGSWHSGGCQVGLADGSVQFISQSTDINVLRAMATINSGETVNIGQ